MRVIGVAGQIAVALRVRRSARLAALLAIATLLSILTGSVAQRTGRTVAVAFELLWYFGDGPLAIQSAAPPRLEKMLVVDGQEFAVDVYDPGGFGGRAGIVLANGIEPAGRRYEPLVELAETLARVGIVVAVPDLVSYGEYRLEPGDVGRLQESYRYLLDEIAVDPGRSGFLGFSAGGSLTVIAATDSQIASEVGFVALVGPYSDLRRVVSFAITGAYPRGRGFTRYNTEVLVWQVTRNTILSGLADEQERAILARIFSGTSPVPVPSVLEQYPDLALSDDGRAIYELFANRDPGAVAGLVARLPTASRNLLTSLSPALVAPVLAARLLLMHEGGDPYFPVYESSELVASLPGQASLISTALLEHAVLRTPPATPSNIVGFYVPESFKLLAYIYNLLEETDG